MWNMGESQGDCSSSKVPRREGTGREQGTREGQGLHGKSLGFPAGRPGSESLLHHLTCHVTVGVA